MTRSPPRRYRPPLVHRRKDEARSDINVTPLVDVCLVLLIIFMVVNEKLQRGMDVRLPEARHHAAPPDAEQPIVSITQEAGTARIYWDRELIAGPEDLKTRAAEALRRKSQPIYVKASTDLTYRDVYPVLIALHQAGTPVLQLGTRELSEE